MYQNDEFCIQNDESLQPVADGRTSILGASSVGPRNRFVLELLPTLLGKCQKQVHRALLTTLVRVFNILEE